MKRRPHFQSRFLIVAIVLLVAAGAVVRNLYGVLIPGMPPEYRHGWPMVYLVRDRLHVPIGHYILALPGPWPWSPTGDLFCFRYVAALPFAVDVLTAIVMTGCTCFAVGRWIGWREASFQFSLRSLLMLPLVVALCFTWDRLFPTTWIPILSATVWLGVGCTVYTLAAVCIYVSHFGGHSRR